MTTGSQTRAPAATLELLNVSKKFGEVTALQPIDLSFRADRTYVLLGTSGCGKSTLLKLALGLVRSDTGSVLINGDKLSDENRLPLRRRIGYVIQKGGLFPHRTARENVCLVARFLHWGRKRIDARIDELSGLTRLPYDLLDRYPAQLSGGQQQRVGLMRALFLEPQLLLLDEPLGALDPIIRSELQNDLRDIFRALNKTVVMVTHDVHEAAFFADEILLLRSGQVVQRGTIQELIDAPSNPFVTQFINAQRNPIGGV